MNYIPSAADLLEMSLYGFAEHARELQAKVPQMSELQRAAFIRICQNIAVTLEDGLNVKTA